MSQEPLSAYHGVFAGTQVGLSEREAIAPFVGRDAAAVAERSAANEGTCWAPAPDPTAPPGGIGRVATARPKRGLYDIPQGSEGTEGHFSLAQKRVVVDLPKGPRGLLYIWAASGARGSHEGLPTSRALPSFKVKAQLARATARCQRAYPARRIAFRLLLQSRRGRKSYSLRSARLPRPCATLHSRRQ